jgi:hypothetical protein
VLQTLTEEYERRMAAKLGLRAYSKELSLGLLQLMFAEGADWTNTWRALSSVPSEGELQCWLVAESVRCSAGC